VNVRDGRPITDRVTDVDCRYNSVITIYGIMATVDTVNIVYKCGRAGVRAIA